MRTSLKLLEELGAVECIWSDGCDSSLVQEMEQNNCSTLSVNVELTPLGFHLATLWVDPRVGKMIIY